MFPSFFALSLTLCLGAAYCGCTARKEMVTATAAPGTKSDHPNPAVENAADEAQRHLAAHDFGGAVAPLRELARLRPETPDVFMMLGTCVLRAANPGQFLAAARKDLERDPNDPVALTIAANALTGTENQKERVALMRRLVEVRPKDFGLRLTLAQELVNAHFYPEARQHLDILLAPSAERKSDNEEAPAPDTALPYYLRGKALFYEATDPTHLSAAETDLNEAARRNPNLAYPYLFLGRVYLNRNQPKEALGLLEKAQEGLPGNAEPLFELARAYRALGDKAKTAQMEIAFRQRRDLENRCTALVIRCGAFPNDFDLHLQTATALTEKGDFAEASVYLHRALALRPRDPRARALAQRLISQAQSGSAN